MESHSDKSSSLSADSGGLIDLYALDSDCKIGDSSQASLGSTDKSKEVSENLFDKRRRQPSGEACLLDIDTRMKGRSTLPDMKLIEEEEFDFDIPDDYLNISMEPEQLSSTEEESLSSDVPSPDLQGMRGLLVEVEEGRVVSHKVQGGDKMCFGANKQHQCFIEVGDFAPLCVGPEEDPCSHGKAGNVGLGISQVLTFEEISRNGSAGVVELLPMGCCDTTRVLSTSKRDLIAFTPASQDLENSQEGFDCVSILQCNSGEDCRNVSPIQAYVCLEQLGHPEVSGEEQLGSLDVPGQIVEEQLGHPEVSGQMIEEQIEQDEVSGEEQLGSLEVSGQMVLGQPEALGQIGKRQCSSSSKSQEIEGTCGEGSSVGELQRRSDSAVPLNRSRLPTPRTELKRCSTFTRSPVKCVQLEELREASRQLTDHLLPQPCPSETCTDVTAALSSLPSDTSAIQQSSSCETFVVSCSSSSNSPTAEVGRENLDDSRSSCISQASQVSNTSSTASRSSRESSIGSHGGGVSKLSRKPGRVGGIPRASSQSKLAKPGSSKPSLLPSKPVTSISMGIKKLPEKPPAKPTVLTRDAQGSHSNLRLRLPSCGAGGSSSSVSGGDGVQAGATNSTMIPRKPRNNDKGSRIAHPMRATGLMKPAASTGKIPTYSSNKLLNSKATQQHHGTSAGHSATGGTGGPKSKLTSPAPRRRNSTNPAAANTNSHPATAMTHAQQTSAVTATSTLSTSIVSAGSPSVQHSTPVKETPRQKLVDRTPKRNLVQSTPDRVRPRFSLSSIESITPNPPPPDPCPHTNETYSVGGGEGVTKTPKSAKKGRRSLIPTPGGQERGCSRRVGSPVPFSFGGECTFSVVDGEQKPQLVNGSSPSLKNKELGAGDHSKRTNMPPPKTKRLLKPGMRPSGLQRPVQRMGTRVLGVRPNGSTSTREPMKAKSTFAFGGYDEDSEVPLSSARVVHSPLDKENRLATPHSKWSPIRKRRLTADEECIQCTKRTIVRQQLTSLPS